MIPSWTTSALNCRPVPAVARKAPAGSMPTMTVPWWTSWAADPSATASASCASSVPAAIPTLSSRILSSPTPAMACSFSSGFSRSISCACPLWRGSANASPSPFPSCAGGCCSSRCRRRNGLACFPPWRLPDFPSSSPYPHRRPIPISPPPLSAVLRSPSSSPIKTRRLTASRSSAHELFSHSHTPWAWLPSHPSCIMGKTT